MTISSDMTEDSSFEEKLKEGIYQLAVLHYKPEDEAFFCMKCGSEQLYISLPSGNPLAFYPEVHLKDLDGLSILLLSRIGFWSGIHRAKTPNSKYLLQVEESSFAELAGNSKYPIFSSSYFVERGETLCMPPQKPHVHGDRTARARTQNRSFQHSIQRVLC